MSHPVEDGTVDLLRRTLDRLSAGASVVASNLANVDTPGYRALQASFPEELESAGGLRPTRTDDSHIGPGAVEPEAAVSLVEAPAKRIRQDGNTVDVDREMATLAALKGRFAAATQMIRKRFALLRYAATDGRS